MSSEDVRSLVQRIVDQDHSSLPAKIISFDEENLRADVQLLNTDEEQNAPTIVNVPVSVIRAGGFIIRPPYQEDDIVLLVFSDTDLENSLFDGAARPPARIQTSQLDYGIVVGGLTADEEAISISGQADSLQIATEDDSGRIEVQTDGTVIVDSGSVKLGNQSNLEKLVQATVQSAINGHTHPGDSGGTTGPPNQVLIADTDLTEETEGS